ncbi:MAG: alkaline phosphatase family protein [Chloroflexi bacterium]|nr:alkaline phosphatase family protein [Chloroflexota bacterium]
MDQSKRIMIIGLDGATWDVLDRWIKDGTLPNLARLRGEGSWGVLRSTIPPITAAAWSTFMTGKRPSKHGVFHFINLFGGNGDAKGKGNENGNENENGNGELVSARSLKASALWDILGHHERKVLLINIPLTYPPRPVNGAMVTGLLTPRNAQVFTYPAELSNEIKAMTDYKIDLDRFVDKTPFVDEIDGEIVVPSLTLVDEFRDMLEKRARVTFSLMNSQPWDFFMIVFIGTDRMGHYLWEYQSGKAGNSPEAQALSKAVREYYIRLDEICGELLKKAGDTVTTLLMSDHGMGPKHTKKVHVNNWLREHGWLYSIKSNGAMSNPDGLLKRLGLSRDRVGRIVHKLPGVGKSQLLKKAATAGNIQIDYAGSKAYAIPIFNHIFGIRLNVKGEERERLRSEITQQLATLIDPQTGCALVEHVYRGEDYYQGPYAENIPDIIVMLNPDYGASYRLGSYSSHVTELQFHSHRGNHRMEGIFAARGAEIAQQPNPLAGLDIEDIAPTVLHLMGLPVPTDMDGRVLTEIFTPEFQAKPIQPGAALDFWTNKSGEKFQEQVMSEEDEAEIRERLQALGYIE